MCMPPEVELKMVQQRQTGKFRAAGAGCAYNATATILDRNDAGLYLLICVWHQRAGSGGNATSQRPPDPARQRWRARIFYDARGKAGGPHGLKVWTTSAAHMSGLPHPKIYLCDPRQRTCGAYSCSDLGLGQMKRISDIVICLRLNQAAAIASFGICDCLLRSHLRSVGTRRHWQRYRALAYLPLRSLQDRCPTAVNHVFAMLGIYSSSFINDWYVPLLSIPVQQSCIPE
jgi:hypothetical protein